MKKVYIENKWEIDEHRKKRFAYEQKRKKVRIQKWQNNKLEKLQYSVVPSRISKDLKKSKSDIRKMDSEKIKCPEEYSFIYNTREFIEHLNIAKEIWRSKKLVNFDLEDIKILTFDSLCLLLAASRNKQDFEMGVRWNFPRDPQIREFVRKSWFLEDFSWKKSWGMFHRESNKQLSLWLSKTIIKAIEKHTFLNNKNAVKIAKIHPFLVEAMKNTDDHAWDWYNRRVFFYKDKDLVTKVCFLDLWKWVLNTMYTKIEQIFRNDPREVIKDLFEGNIESPKRRTKTKEEKRWTWLPSIYKFLTGEKIQNAYAITNNIKFDISNNVCEYLKMDFHWTFYYREIKP